MVYKVNELPRKCYKKKKIVLLFLIIERDSLSWGERWESNPRVSGSQPDVLTTSPHSPLAF